ncbi:MAG TPA: hypothetical protein GX742_04430 [Acholeplasmataceae bacterium]|nr:hypothetical protein [Acholeplasmataceae bacterium]
MEYFKVHFFKEKVRTINVEELIAFFENLEDFTIEMDEDSVRFNYKHPRLGYTAQFLIMPKSQISDIHRLNPRYLAINVHLELPLLTPDYFARHMFLIAKKLADKFNYFVYQSYFEDVLPFKLELLMKIFNLVKDKYLELNPKIAAEYHMISKDNLSAILRYTDDNLELQKFYRDLETYVPYYYILLNNENEINLAIEWTDDTLTVIPPHLDYIFYNKGSEVVILKYNEVSEQISKFLDDVPGFLRNTLVVPKKNKKKVLKVMRKYKFTKINDRFTKIDLKTLLD